MAEPQGFLRVHKQEAPKRPMAERIHDWREIYVDRPQAERNTEVAVLHGLRAPFCARGRVDHRARQTCGDHRRR
jgi:hypothetical protein